MDPADAAALAARLEPLHSMIYFVPEVGEELAPAGITRDRDQYFAQRSAPMGAVGPGVVAATFFNFNPALVARSVPMVWAQAAPADVVNARLRAADAALRRLLDDQVSSRAVTEAGELVRRACDGATGEDRPLYAAHADLPWPEEPHLALWHGVTLLREHRGDAHLHALLSAGLSGIEALVTHTATGRGFTVAFAQRSRGWSPEQWSDASAGLTERGLLDAGGTERSGADAPEAGHRGLTETGVALRAEIEDHTTRMSLGPWRHLGAEGTARLREVAAPLSKAVLPAFAVEGVFAPRSPRASSS
ncbi:SCO6745 family protein [Actinomycetospora sp. CA-101289]|uniref:SCO6745 family protein n=1 Tax=Actinomycetospora sp. CA-101289 TaxID=3239893 RepID=UPI003D961D50